MANKYLGEAGVERLIYWANNNNSIIKDSLTDAMGRICDIEIVLGDLDDAYRFHRRVEKMRQRQQWRNKR